MFETWHLIHWLLPTHIVCYQHIIHYKHIHRVQSTVQIALVTAPMTIIRWVCIFLKLWLWIWSYLLRRMCVFSSPLGFRMCIYTLYIRVPHVPCLIFIHMIRSLVANLLAIVRQQGRCRRYHMIRAGLRHNICHWRTSTDQNAMHHRVWPFSVQRNNSIQ